MPASKKDLRAKKQKDNVKAGIGDANGRLPSQNKVGTFNMTQWKPGCTVPKKGSLFSVFKLNSVYWCVCDELIYALIPLPVPNWASAEAQFIQNFSLSIQIFHCRGIKRKVGAGEIGI